MDAPLFTALKTERLVLRAYRTEDAPALHRLINDWEVCRNLAAVPFPYARKQADAFIARAAVGLQEGSVYHLAISGREGDTETLVGGASLHIDAMQRSGRLGYWVGRRFWGHGVATEAAGRLVRWALANLDLDLLKACVATDNPASVAVLRHIGFVQLPGTGSDKFVARGGEVAVFRFEATRGTLAGESGPSAAPATTKATTAAADRPLLLVAACALIDIEGRVLLQRRPEGKRMAGLWEFPGGKLAPGETPEAALIRELREELGIDVAKNCLAAFAFASHPYENFHLLMPLFLCRRWKGVLQAREGQALAWVRREKLADYKMPPADRPLVPLLRDFL
jgi:8-oxo-dGTP diphosphatase